MTPLDAQNKPPRRNSGVVFQTSNQKRGVWKAFFPPCSASGVMYSRPTISEVQQHVKEYQNI